MSLGVMEHFESYQASRVNFVQTIAELATRPQNIDGLVENGNHTLIYKTTPRGSETTVSTARG